MFSSSLRRALLKVPASPVHATFSSSTTKAVALKYRPQRRYSSSKPSSPANGAKADGHPLQTSSARRQKAKDSIDDRSANIFHLPSVPSTGHLKEQDVTASDFFSLHRPISVTEVWPRAVSDESFSSIFSRYTTETKPADVIGTLSNTIAGIDTALRNQMPFQDSLQEGIDTEAETRLFNRGGAQAEAAPSVFIAFPSQPFNTNFMPFNKPPPPRPMHSEQIAASNKEAAEGISKSAQAKTYHALITVEESKDENGEVQYKSYASEFVPATQEEPAAPRTYIERMRVRIKRYEDALDQRDSSVWAISVKRQRKLKMKKHKYKKLMRKMRTARRRADRT